MVKYSSSEIEFFTDQLDTAIKVEISVPSLFEKDGYISGNRVTSVGYSPMKYSKSSAVKNALDQEWIHKVSRFIIVTLDRGQKLNGLRTKLAKFGLTHQAR